MIDGCMCGLIDHILDLSTKSSIKPKKVLDLGTGTGCLLLSVLEEFPNAVGVGVDKSSEALDVARTNANQLGFGLRTQFIQSNWLNNIDSSVHRNFDLIISNPPYIAPADYPHLNPTVNAWEPVTALVANREGLEEYDVISKSIMEKKILDRDDGLLVFEIGKDQENDIVDIVQANGFKLDSMRKDLGGIFRSLAFRSHN
ncbi:hypothetical protein SAMD00019534_081420 [Acytostelium subglobosum LB1]|uniref:hypothetical protein n=1 Tax=Acytostelium subglobosum LB1 TaxID=1410327 RepID=UPI000644894F|nr:hypothetical protein SAMD00019534_081420 [Acytostelium subglobosum LB1]GAM24967.1 hypothetical protein SAMD00019534_081420 [Acytostelium subglobosum LB1]|eukprot:XP_012752056.1 hypothetical protein SAMD00019534_081420 [Acytostelium subglobosum LB1]